MGTPHLSVRIVCILILTAVVIILALNLIIKNTQAVGGETAKSAKQRK